MLQLIAEGRRSLFWKKFCHYSFELMKLLLTRRILIHLIIVCGAYWRRNFINTTWFQTSSGSRRFWEKSGHPFHSRWSETAANPGCASFVRWNAQMAIILINRVSVSDSAIFSLHFDVQPSGRMQPLIFLKLSIKLLSKYLEHPIGYYGYRE